LRRWLRVRVLEAMRRRLVLALLILGAFLAGAAVAAGAGETSWSPASFDFGKQAVGTQSPPHVFTLTAGPSGYDSDPAIVNSATDWDVLSTDCGQPLPPGGSCQFEAVFRPHSPGPLTGHLVGKYPYSGPVAILTGTGVSGAHRKKCKKKHYAVTAKKRCRKKPR
jgi:hypothetical protein